MFVKFMAPLQVNAIRRAAMLIDILIIEPVELLIC